MTTSAFVSLDKYKQDMLNLSVQLEYARKKFGRIDTFIKNSVFELKQLRSFVKPEHLSKIDDVLSMLNDCLETEKPHIAAVPPPPSLDRVKFSSVADGVQAHFEFEGER